MFGRHLGQGRQGPLQALVVTGQQGHHVQGQLTAQVPGEDAGSPVRRALSNWAAVQPGQRTSTAALARGRAGAEPEPALPSLSATSKRAPGKRRVGLLGKRPVGHRCLPSQPLWISVPFLHPTHPPLSANN